MSSNNNDQKNKPDSRGYVFSTDPNFRVEEEPHEPAETLPPNLQKIKIKLDTRQRAGKTVTLIEGFIGKQEDLDELGKKLKNFCGTGGSVKDRQIIIQGNQKEKVFQWLLKNDFNNTKQQ